MNFRSHLVIRHRPDGTLGILNIVEEATQELQERAAQRLAAGWGAHFPSDRIEVRGSNTAHHCRPVNNLSNELAH